MLLHACYISKVVQVFTVWTNIFNFLSFMYLHVYFLVYSDTSTISCLESVFAALGELVVRCPLVAKKKDAV